MDCSTPVFPVHQQLPEPLLSIASVMPSNHLILCRPILLPPSIFSSIRVFSNESVLQIRWPHYWSFSFSISPSNEHLGLISLGWTGWISLQSKGLSRVFSNTTVKSINSSALGFVFSPTLTSIHDYWKNQTWPLGRKKKHFFPYSCQIVQLFDLPLQIVHCRPTSSS